MSLTAYTEPANATNITGPVTITADENGQPGNLNCVGVFSSGSSGVGGVASDGGGNITSVGNVIGTGIFEWGSIGAQGEAANQAVATGGTILTPAKMTLLPLTAAAAATGMIMTKGTTSGQMVILINEGATNTITFAASGTSFVALGTGAAIAALTKLILVWDNTAQLWY